MKDFKRGKYADNKQKILELKKKGHSGGEIASILEDELHETFSARSVQEAIQSWTRENNAFEDKLEENNFTPPENWSYGWLKTKEASVFIKNEITQFQFDWDEFVKIMSETVTPSKVVRQGSENDLALHLYHSDMHVGAWVSDNSVYKNNYSYEEVKRRLELVRALALNKFDEMGVFHTLVLFDLGDMLDGLNGNTTRGGHKLPQNMSNMEQFEAAIMLYKTHIASLVTMGIAENYVFYATCNDNHSGNFSYFALRALAEWCNFAYPEVSVHIQTKFIDVYEYGSHTFIISHGKDIEFMKHGMPKYLDKKTEVYIKDYIHHNNINGNTHFIKGDLHQDCVDFCNRFRYRNVLSLFGASEWIFTNYGYSRAGISYDIVNMNTKDVMEGRLFF